MEATNDRSHLELSVLELRQRKSGRIFLVGIGLAVLYGSLVFASFMRPYAYESSDRGWSYTQDPLKGPSLAQIKESFRKYTVSSGKQGLVLHRTFKPALSTMVAWIHHFNHDRWDLPYLEPAARPARSQQSAPQLETVQDSAEGNDE